LRTVKKKVFRV